VSETEREREKEKERERRKRERERDVRWCDFSATVAASPQDEDRRGICRKYRSIVLTVWPSKSGYNA
jgi:hypothetical protein